MAINRGIFPGTFTMGNAVCGFLSLLSTYEGNIVGACWFILLAGFLDALDGKVARLSNTTSQFGVELDSLADFLSFGIAPAMLVYAVKLNALGKWGWVISIVFIMASSYRLARYNLMADSEEKGDFLGLPVPAAAMAPVTFILFSFHLWGELRYGEFLISMLVLNAFLMVSQVQYDVLPDRFHSKLDRFKVLLMIASVGILIISIIVNGRLFNARVLLFPMITMYILSGIVREVVRLSSAGVTRMTGKQADGLNQRRRSTDEKE